MKNRVKYFALIPSMLGLLFISCGQKPKTDKGSDPVAALFIVYAFEARTTGAAMEYPILPGQTEIMNWDEVVKNTEEVKNRLKSIYNYQTYILRRMLCYSWYRDENGWQSDFKSGWVEIQPTGDLLDGRLSYSVMINGDMLDKVHTVRVAGQTGETTVIGTPLEKSGPGKSALFITVTPVFQTICNQSDYQQFIQKYQDATSMAPSQPRASHYFLINWLNQLATETLKIKEPVNSDSLAPNIRLETGNDGDINPVAYDTPPSPVGGLASLSKHLIYPEPARKAGIEGQVFVYVQIDTAGRMTHARVVQSPDESLEQAALAALEKITWAPAKKDERPVSVWIGIPIKFKL